MDLLLQGMRREMKEMPFIHDCEYDGTFTCYECNENCQRTRDELLHENLDPDSRERLDRMEYCAYAMEYAIFD